jgi:hypothetical protein
MEAPCLAAEAANSMAASSKVFAAVTCLLSDGVMPEMPHGSMSLRIGRGSEAESRPGMAL